MNRPVLLLCRFRPAGPADAPELARLRYDFRVELGEPNEEREVFVARCAAWMASLTSN